MLQKIIIIIGLLLLVLVAVGVYRFIAMGSESQKGSAPGLAQGQLQPCPDSPNCAISEYADDAAHFVEPITLDESLRDSVLERAALAIQSMGGKVTESTEDYLASEFKSDLFGFVDDFEVRLDQANSMLHLRSASRVGYGDMGVNAKRVAEFKATFTGSN